MGYGVRPFQVVATIADHGPVTFEDLLARLPAPVCGGVRPEGFEACLRRFLTAAEGRYVELGVDGKYSVTEYGRKNLLSLGGSLLREDWEMP